MALLDSAGGICSKAKRPPNWRGFSRNCFRTTALVAIFPALIAGCSSPNPTAAAADAICADIDDEVSDVAAFEGYELAVARERRNGMDEAELQAAVGERCGRAIIAISGDAADSAELAPEEVDEDVSAEPEPEVVDVREIDWASETWLTSCSEKSEHQADGTHDLQPVTLTVPDEGERWYHGNRLEVADGVPLYEVYGAEVVYGDVTGDGVDDAIFTTVCSQGNIEVATLEVWEGGTEPVHLPEVVSFGRDGYVERVETLDGHLRVFSSEAAPSDELPWINGYSVEVVTDWTYEAGDQQWVSTEVSRVDTTPAPASEPESQARPNDSVVLRGDGLGLVRLGDAEGTTRQRLEDVLGASDQMFDQCPPEVEVRWGPLSVFFADDVFLRYSLHGDTDFETDRGISVGSTRAEAEAAYGNSFEITANEEVGVVLRLKADGGELWGNLDGTDASSRIIYLSAGERLCGDI